MVVEAVVDVVDSVDVGDVVDELVDGVVGGDEACVVEVVSAFAELLFVELRVSIPKTRPTTNRTDTGRTIRAGRRGCPWRKCRVHLDMTVFTLSCPIGVERLIIPGPAS